ncbi:MAG: DUF427 domain-containing protein [Rhizobiaceae bacterium]
MDQYANASPGFRDHPEHTISVEPFGGVVVVTFGEAIIASSKEALELKETNHAPVFYIPFKDVYFDFLNPSQTKTHCPFKGDASHWNASASGEAMKDVMWAYLSPFDEMIAIKDHAAFYPSKVRIDATPLATGPGETARHLLTE